MKKPPASQLVKQLQGYLDQISVLPKDQLERFLILKKRAKRVLNRLKKEYPELQSFPVRVDPLSVRREVSQPVQDMMQTPDTPPPKEK